MSNIISFVKSILCVTLFLAIAITVIAGEDDNSWPQHRFIGHWINVDPQSQGLTKLDIKAGDPWTFHAWGKCHPHDCDLGAHKFNLVGHTAYNNKSLEYGFVTWESNFKKTYLTIRLYGDQLIVDGINIFTDDSGRSNYRSQSSFKKKKS